ncbi:hypothetical protein BGZ83_011128 [Gryganskiella cystojenkinii]|nr:hypothetical protein BGZ83_011128 [Gryganskiella cystojenkinii]
MIMSYLSREHLRSAAPVSKMFRDCAVPYLFEVLDLRGRVLSDHPPRSQLVNLASRIKVVRLLYPDWLDEGLLALLRNALILETEPGRGTYDESFPTNLQPFFAACMRLQELTVRGLDHLLAAEVLDQIGLGCRTLATLKIYEFRASSADLVDCLRGLSSLRTLIVVRCEFEPDTREIAAESVVPLGLKMLHFLEHRGVGLVQDLKHSFKLARLQDVKLYGPPLQERELIGLFAGIPAMFRSISIQQGSITSTTYKQLYPVLETLETLDLSRCEADTSVIRGILMECTRLRTFCCRDLQMESLVESGNDGRNLGCDELEVFNIFILTWLGASANSHVRALDQLFSLTKLRQLAFGTLFVPSMMAKTDLAESWREGNFTREQLEVDQDMKWMVETWPYLTEFTISRRLLKFRPTIPPRRRKPQVAA